MAGRGGQAQAPGCCDICPCAAIEHGEWRCCAAPHAEPGSQPACALLLCDPDAVQDMRTWKQAEEAGKAVGFRLLESRDVAQASRKAVQPW